MSDYYRELADALRGATIVSATFEPSADYYDMRVPRLFLRQWNHDIIEVEIWADEEGNGPGALAIVDVRVPAGRGS